MKALSDQAFLMWAAEVGLVPDPAYPSSRQQLVFVSCPDCWGVWESPRASGELATFVGLIIGLVGGHGPLRIRLRGGGRFGVTNPSSEREEALHSALAAAGIPDETAGALEFDSSEWRTLVDIAIAFLSFGYRVETDLEIVAPDRSACLMLDHHGDVEAHFSSQAAFRSFTDAMTAAGYRNPAEEQSDE